MDEGYFPRGSSLLRQVQEERLVGLFYGQRALMIGALNPVNYAGTSQATGGRLAPFKRLARTARDFETVFFGTRAEADRVLAKVRRMHEQVVGVLAEPAGPYAAGTPYAANDPALLLWTVAVTADSALCFYELLVRRLTDWERDAFWQDYVRFGELFGMPRAVAPPTYAAFRAWWDEQLTGETMHLTDEARYMGRAAAFEIPMPAINQGAKRLHDLVMGGTIPPRVRELYGLDWTAAHAVAFSAAVALLRGLRKVVPSQLMRGSNTRSFALVEATERRRILLGRPTPQLPPLSAGAGAAQAPAATPSATPGSSSAPSGRA
jgi:uncharacterized protein (DUF2236 family)